MSKKKHKHQIQAQMLHVRDKYVITYPADSNRCKFLVVLSLCPNYH